MTALSASRSASRQTAPATRWPLPLGQISLLLTTATAAAVAQFVSILPWGDRPDLHIAWLPGAVHLSVLLASRRSVWLAESLGALLGMTLSFFVLGAQPLGALVASAPVVLTMAALAWSLGARAGGIGTLGGFSEVARFMILVALAAFFIGIAARFSSTLELGGMPAPATWWSIALANALGCLLVVPFWLNVVRPSDVPDAGERSSEWFMTIAAIATVGLAWALWYEHDALHPVLFFLPIPVFAFALLRVHVGAAVVSIFVLTLIATLLAQHLKGPFADVTQRDLGTSIQLWSLSMTVALLLLATALRQRRTAQIALSEAHTELHTLAGRLISAQEDERSSIARELHDSIGQNIACAAILVSTLRAQQQAGEPLVLKELQQQLSDLSEDVRNLSHHLHPGVLKHVGLTAALEGLCAIYRKQEKTDIVFNASGDVDAIPEGPKICIYRVVQEALRNAVTHGKAQRIAVVMMRRSRAVRLEILDDGEGFSLDSAEVRAGLGLVSMQERVRSEGGRFRIATAPGRGTRISIRLELA